MATLAAQTATDLLTLISGKKGIALTRQDSATASVDATLLAAVCAQASAKVRARLGLTVDGDDAVALDLCIRLALLRLSTVYSLTLNDAGQAMISGVYSELEQEAVTRRQAISQLEVVEGDFETLDTKYPYSTWDVDETDNTDND